MTDRDAVDRWLDGYRRAWRTNDPADIAALFTDDARYLTSPTDDPLVGHDAIVEDWVARADDPDDWTERLAVLAVDGDVAVVQGEVDYTNGDRFVNLWVIRLGDDGRASEFTEWWLGR